MKMALVSALMVAFMITAPARAQAPKQAVASPAVQADFEGFIAKFRAAIKANDSSAVAGMTKLPFMEDKAYSDAAKFRAKAYPEFFTAKNRACIQHTKAIYDRDGDNNDTYHIACSESIFTFTRTPAGFMFTDVGGND